MSTRTLVSLIGVALLCLGAGCASNKGRFGDRTAILIEDRTVKEILDATELVFIDKGYEAKSRSKTDAVFEIKGSKWQAAAWGGWTGGVWERATIKVIEYGAGSHLLEAEVKLVGDRGDEFFEDTKSLSRRGHKPYQELLNQVQAKLATLPRTP